MPIIVLLMLLLLLGGTSFYLAHRTHRWISYFFPKLSIVIPFVFFILMTIIMFLSIAKPFGGGFQRVLSLVGSYWMGIFVYLLFFFLLADIITFLPSVFKLFATNKLTLIRMIASLTATALAISFSVYGFFHAKQITIADYDISLSENAETKINLVMISDVHLGSAGSETKLEKIVDEINRQKPDLVCIAGDFFDSDFSAVQNPQKAITTMRKINSQFGVYAVLGNHDSGKSLPLMRDFFAKSGVTLLQDEYKIIDNSFVLVGRLDVRPIHNTENLKRKELNKILLSCDEDLPIVVMDHNPKEIGKYEAKATLVLSGHTHKGQIFPGNLITNAMYDADYGYYKTKNGVHAVISSGVGYWGPPMRVGTNCEIVRINLLV